MKLITAGELRNVFSKAEILVADPNLGIGKDLHFDNPLRTIVVFFVEADVPEYLTIILKTILAVENSWLFVPRPKKCSIWGIELLEGANEAILIEPSDKEKVIEHLCSNVHELYKVGDYYLISESGSAILNFSHHIFDDGLEITLGNIDQSEQLLVNLNRVGCELDLYFRSN